jgi:hypothetical protein
MSDIQSRPYKVGACCEACIFGRGEHAAWCAECLNCGSRLNLYEAMRTAHGRANCGHCGAIVTISNPADSCGGNY